ncbi:MAG: DUF2635 domain-containing protein [Alphaproteobacteria bacterium]
MAENKFFVKPARENGYVLKPNGLRLKPSGEWIYGDVEFWHRRLKDGDVVGDTKAKAPAETKAEATTPAPASSVSTSKKEGIK